MHKFLLTTNYLRVYKYLYIYVKHYILNLSYSEHYQNISKERNFKKLSKMFCDKKNATVLSVSVAAKRPQRAAAKFHGSSDAFRIISMLVDV